MCFFSIVKIIIVTITITKFWTQNPGAFLWVACSPHVCVDSLHVLWLSPTAPNHAFGDRWIGKLKLSLGVNESVNGCSVISVALHWVGTSSRVYPTSRSYAAGIGSSNTSPPHRPVIPQGWLGGWVKTWFQICDLCINFIYSESCFLGTANAKFKDWHSMCSPVGVQYNPT